MAHPSPSTSKITVCAGTSSPCRSCGNEKTWQNLYGLKIKVFFPFPCPFLQQGFWPAFCNFLESTLLSISPFFFLNHNLLLISFQYLFCSYPTVSVVFQIFSFVLYSLTNFSAFFGPMPFTPPGL
jgi:hypothetical protein